MMKKFLKTLKVQKIKKIQNLKKKELKIEDMKFRNMKPNIRMTN